MPIPLSISILARIGAIIDQKQPDRVHITFTFLT